MEQTFTWIKQLAITHWIAVIFLGNFIAYGISIGTCIFANRFFSHRKFEWAINPVTSQDIILSVIAVILNSMIGVIGWVLWRNDLIKISFPSTMRSIFDTVVLLFCMDFAMYIFHRAAHLRVVYPSVHATHHSHISTNPISLFVLNPAEVLGFGGLLILLMMTIPFSGISIIAYLTFNLIFGTMGHLTTEPLPSNAFSFKAMRLLGTSTFHALHHQHPNSNFGFYTTIWDRIFGTLDPEYDERILGSKSFETSSPEA